MKSLVKFATGFALAILAGISSAAPAQETGTAKQAQIRVPAVLTKSAGMEVWFPTPMIAETDVGKELPGQDFLILDPALKGTFKWNSRYSGTFSPDEVPAIGTTYTATLVKGLKDGASAEVKQIGSVKAQVALFNSVNYTPRWFEPGHFISRQPAITIQFNDAVDLESLTKQASFVDKAAFRVPVSVTLAQKDQAAGMYVGDWEQAYLGNPSKELADDETAPNIAVIQPLKPLPPGENWTLSIASGVENGTKTAYTDAPINIAFGTIQSMAVTSISADSPLNARRQLSISFSKSLPDKYAAAEIAKFVSVTPAPANGVWEIDGSLASLVADFEIGIDYQVAVKKSVPSLDGTRLETPGLETVKFTPHEAGLGIAAVDEAQWIGGRKEFSCDLANLESVNVKIKRIDPQNIVYAMRGFQTYSNDPSKGEENWSFTRIPYDAVPGKTVWEHTFKSAVELDRTESFTFKWNEVLKGDVPGVYFVSLEGTPKAELEDRKRVGTQALIQLTDVGLAWKFNHSEAMVFAFSHSTGLPLKDVQLMSFDDDNNPVETQSTDASGMATMKLDKTRWLVAANALDWHGVEFHPDMPKVSLWQFDLSYNRVEDREWRDTLIFTDRPVYQPGETVFLKCITRAHNGDGLSFHANQKAKVRAFDIQNRLFMEKEIQFSATGTYDDSFVLPGGGVGQCRFEIAFLNPVAEVPPAVPGTDVADPETDEESDEDFEEEGDGLPDGVESTQNHYVLVQEYRPNAFKIKFDDKAVQRDGETVNVPISAAYFMGKVLSEATVKWSSTLNQSTYYSQKFPDYHFDATRITSFYDGETYRYISDNEWVRSQVTAQGEETLSDKGAAVLPAKVPATFGIPGPKQLTVAAEITDINQQTIADTYSQVIHSSEFYLGVRRTGRTARIGEEYPVDVVAIDPSEQKWKSPVKGKLLVERMTWNAVKVEVAGGGTETRNEVGRVVELEQDVEISPEPGKEIVAKFTPAQPGTYVISVTSADAQGAPVQSTSAVYVYGAPGATFEQNEGIKIDLEADKDSYVPGDVAKIVVKSPFKGKAIVSVERQKVFSIQVIDLDGASGVVEIPITEALAPNCFVSVTHLRGGANDPRDHKQPDYKMGYKELTVNSTRDALTVALTPAKPEFRPGENVEIVAEVKDHEGKPVVGAEVTLWAVDEGILSLTAYDIPDPYGNFHYQLPLEVQTGISLDNLLPENPESLDFSNKGFIIGGGDGEGGDNAKAMRKDFKPCAYWNAALATGPDGRVTASFVAPDGLTQYRVVAVVSEGAARFGNAESSFKINKPLMLEPAMPVFANVGDELIVKAVVHNTTAFAGEVAVNLELDSSAAFLDASKGEVIAEKKLEKTLSMNAGQTRAAYFHVKFVTAGPAIWKWSAQAPGGPPELVDAVQSTITVGYAEPILRDIHFATLTEAPVENLLAGIRPELLDSAGKVEIQVSNSILIEGAEAIGQVLHYPYGCVEQTTSSMLPWIALKEVKKAIPGIDRPDAEIAMVIQKGADRLLSMQTSGGGLGYWPGAAEPSAWGSAHGGMGLIMAQKAGAIVPQSRIDGLAKYLSTHLRSELADDNSYGWDEKSMACYTLALAGKPEPAYHETLFQKRAQLGEVGRSMLALAVIASNGPADMARTLLTEALPKHDAWWLGGESAVAMRSLAWSRMKDAAQADAAIVKVIQQRSPRGDWRNTFNNAWVLLALAEYGSGTQPWNDTESASFVFDGATQEAKFGAEPAAQTLTFDTKGGGKLPVLTAKLPAGKKLYARVQVSARAKQGQTEERSQGFSIARAYQKVGNDGSIVATDEYFVGDLVLVTLNLDLPESAEYLAVDDALPANLEGVNPTFETMAANPVALGGAWAFDYQEMRRDRVLFFRDYFGGNGRFSVQYLARVVAAGNAAIPQAKVEMMYDPARFGLSAGGRFISKAAREGEMAGE